MAYNPNMKSSVGVHFQFGTLVFIADDDGNVWWEELEEPTITFELPFGLDNTANPVQDAMMSTIECS